MLLKIGKHNLDENYSLMLFLKMFQWYYENFGIEIDSQKCQELLFEYKFEIKWIYHKDEGFGFDYVYFYVTVNDIVILNTKLNNISYYEFDLEAIILNDAAKNESFLLQLIKNDISAN